MALITLFSAPKPFTDSHIATIQRNAIKSWTLLPDVAILLIGDEEGVAEAAQEFGVLHMPEVKCSRGGTPLISSMFDLARRSGDSDLLCIINTDIILMPDFLEAAKQVAKLKEKFVLLSQRWDYDLKSELKFTEGWGNLLRASVLSQNDLHRPSGSDFFLFPRTCYKKVPDFAIGRAGWDNWMIFEARREKWPVIDCTPDVMIVHQNHDYHHLPGGKPHYNHPETDTNMYLAGGPAAVRYTILDATHRLKAGKLVRPAFTGLRFWRRVELSLRKILFFLPEETLEKIVRPKRWKKQLQKIFGNQKA